MSSRPETDAEVRASADGGRINEACTIAIRAYGAEVYGFLVATHRHEADADDVFSLFCEKLLKSLAGFRWQCSLRTWIYLLARAVSSNFVEARRGRARHEVPIDSRVLDVAEQVRTKTRSFLKTDVKDEMTRLREELDPEDRELLVLRIDRELAWRDLACVFLDDEAPSEETLKRESARLRTRFQRAKDRLLARAREKGLLAKE